MKWKGWNGKLSLSTLLGWWQLLTTMLLQTLSYGSVTWLFSIVTAKHYSYMYYTFIKSDVVLVKDLIKSKYRYHVDGWAWLVLFTKIMLDKQDRYSTLYVCRWDAEVTNMIQQFGLIFIVFHEGFFGQYLLWQLLIFLCSNKWNEYVVNYYKCSTSYVKISIALVKKIVGLFL